MTDPHARRRPITAEAEAERNRAATAHDPLTAELHAAAAAAGITPAALAATPQWQQRLHPAEERGTPEVAEAAEKKKKKRPA